MINASSGGVHEDCDVTPVSVGCGWLISGWLQVNSPPSTSKTAVLFAPWVPLKGHLHPYPIGLPHWFDVEVKIHTNKTAKNHSFPKNKKKLSRTFKHILYHASLTITTKQIKSHWFLVKALYKALKQNWRFSKWKICHSLENPIIQDPRHQVPVLQLLHQFTGGQSRVGVLGEHHVRLIQGASNCRQKWPSRCQDGSGGVWYESWPISILHYISLGSSSSTKITDDFYSEGKLVPLCRVHWGLEIQLVTNSWQNFFVFSFASDKNRFWSTTSSKLGGFNPLERKILVKSDHLHG